jgi:hypothetical protein
MAFFTAWETTEGGWLHGSIKASKTQSSRQLLESISVDAVAKGLLGI